MTLLELLAACIEQGRTSIAPAMAEEATRKRLDRLHKAGALVRVRARAIICPQCEANSVRVIQVGAGLCRACGQVPLAAEDLQRLAPDHDWLRRRIAQALGLPGEPPRKILPGRLWYLGDLGRAGARKRVLFGQQLTGTAVLRALLDAWPTHVGETQAVIVTTSLPDRVFLPGVPATFIPLPAAFHLRARGLVADDAVWAGVQAPAALLATQRRHGPFSHDFREVTLQGEDTPIALTPSQAAIMRVLWKLDGVSIDRETLIRLAGVALEKPVDAFARNKYPKANKVYRVMVSSDQRGRYSIPSDWGLQ